MALCNDVIALRLYCKAPGTDRLRKSAAAELRHLVNLGWRETNRTQAADHLVLRMERPAVKPPHIPRRRESSAPPPRQQSRRPRG